MARANRETWSRRVEQWVQSGLTAKQFAAQTGVNPNTLAHWKWRLGKAEAVAFGVARAPAFVEVTGVAPVAAPAISAGRCSEGFELVLRDDLRVRVPAQFDPSALRRLLTALEDR